MKLKHLILICIFSLVAAFNSYASDSNDYELEPLLEQLDMVIRNGKQYQQHRLNVVDSIYDVVENQTGWDRVNSYKHAFSLFVHYHTDSAANVLNKLALTPEATSDKNLKEFINIGNAYVLGLIGMYGDAIRLLDKVEQENLDLYTQLFYYQTARTVYGWKADYVATNREEKRYEEIIDRYRDSIIAIDPCDISKSIVLADKCIVNGNPKKAIKLLLPKLETAHPEQLVYIYFNLAEAYRESGNEHMQMYYLALASIRDIQAGLTEYIALPMLATLLSKNGDIERAYNYIIYSMEDANFCKARLRTLEISNIFPIIDKAYKQMERENHRRNHIFSAALIIFILILSAVSLFMWKQNKKLSLTRAQLADANKDLQDLNNQLQLANSNLIKTDKIKEDYIALFLEKCRGYLDALEAYRHSLLRLAKNNEHDKLLRQLKDHTQINDEQTRFYQDFDAAFLNIHPNFVQNFNELLVEEERVYPKTNNQLTTEMRIFALIRLGISDSNKIAHFLNYSLATIYNYRSRITNKSIYNKDEFIARLMKC